MLSTAERRQPILVHNWRLLAWLRVKDSFTDLVGWGLEKFRAPAVLREFEFVDPSSEETIYLYTSNRFAVLCIGEKRFYFNRLSGKFDGTSAPACAVPRRVEFRD